MRRGICSPSAEQTADPSLVLGFASGRLGMTSQKQASNPQHQIRAQHRAQQRAAIAKNKDHFIQMLYLQPVVQRKPKTVRPVKQRQRAQHKQIDPRQRRLRQRRASARSSAATIHPSGIASPNRNS